ncbi:hypothetical protein D7X48_10295 [bacterium D16-50]|nr:hypothetical protein D7X48_10295 [bacterium D16-50]
MMIVADQRGIGMKRDIWNRRFGCGRTAGFCVASYFIGNEQEPMDFLFIFFQLCATMRKQKYFTK